MAGVMLEGFDHYPDATSTPAGAQALWVKSYLDQSLAYGRFGGWCLQHTRNGGTEDIYRDFPNGDITTGQITLGFAWKKSNAVSRPIMRLMQAGTTNSQFTIYENSDGSIAIRNGDSGTVLATSATGLIATNTWYYIEVAVTIADSGSLELRLNNTTVATATGVDTMGQSTNTVGRICLPEPDSSGTYWYDDIYVRDDLVFMGPCRVLYRRPRAAVAGGTFNMTATSAYVYPLRVDEFIVDQSTSYITGSTVGDQQLFQCDNLSKFSGTSVKMVQLVSFSKTDAGTATLAPVVTSGATTSVGADWALTTTFQYKHRIVLDPATSADWTRNGLRDGRFGMKVTGLSGAAQVQVSTFGYEVLLPIADAYADAGGHRYWRITPLTINSSGRPGSWMLHFINNDGEIYRPINYAYVGGLWSSNNDVFQALDGRYSTGYIGGVQGSPASNNVSFDFGGPIAPNIFGLGSQPFTLGESFATFKIEYSDDNATWTPYYTQSTSQTGWTASEWRQFALPALFTPTVRRRQGLVLN